jgi:hypothetical protein
MGQGQKLEHAPLMQRRAEGDSSPVSPALLFSARLTTRCSEPPAEPADAQARTAPVVPRQGIARAKNPLALALLVVALLLVGIARGIVMRALLPVAIVVFAVFLLLRKRRPAPAPVERPARMLILDHSYLALRGLTGSDSVLLEITGRYGVTLVSSRSRDRLVAVMTSAAGTLLIGTTLTKTARPAYAELLSRSVSVANDDAGLDAIGPDGEPLHLEPDDFARLVRTLSRIDPSSCDRLVLSDPSGRPVILDGSDLLVRDLRFDLAAPLEWRSILFQETFGHAVAVYQGTWIRQGGVEVVMVALLPSIAGLSPSIEESTGLSELDRAASRDSRLLQASPDEPPPNDRRVAIDRVFVLPLRAALDRAPRPSSQPLSTSPA